MLVTVGINLAVVAYESREATRFSSEILLADAHADARRRLVVADRDRGAGRRAGSACPILDPLAAIVVAGFIAYSGYQIARATTGILSDRIVISDADLERVVMSVPGVLGCHHIRTRGAADHVFLDLHVWLPPDLRLTEAHDLSHVVKDRLMARYPQIADAVIHIEPPPADRRFDKSPFEHDLSPARVMTRFDAFADRKTAEALSAVIEPFATEVDRAGSDARRDRQRVVATAVRRILLRLAGRRRTTCPPSASCSSSRATAIPWPAIRPRLAAARPTSI